MKLEHVKRRESAGAQAGLEARPDMAAGERLCRIHATWRRPDAILRWHLGRNVEVVSAVVAHDLADNALALPITTCGVDEVHAELDRPVQRPCRLVLLSADPHRSADAPCPVTDLGHRQARPAELAVTHAASPHAPGSVCLSFLVLLVPRAPRQTCPSRGLSRTRLWPKRPISTG